MAAYLLRVAVVWRRSNAYTNETMKYKWTKPLAIWNEKLGTSRNTISGEQYMGCPTQVSTKIGRRHAIGKSSSQAKLAITLTNYIQHSPGAHLSNLSPRLGSVKAWTRFTFYLKNASSASIKTGDVFAIWNTEFNHTRVGDGDWWHQTKHSGALELWLWTQRARWTCTLD